MPTLHKYVDGDGYYIKAYIPGRSQFSTLQVTPQALRRIQAAIGAEQGVFDHSLLQELLREKLVYTKGLFPLSVSVTPSAPPAARRSGVRLVFIEGEHPWSVALRVDELPGRWLEAVDSLVDALSGWRICVPSAPPVPATQLWPGRGGALIRVAPQRQAYEVTPEGRWPSGWDVRAWLGSIPGLGTGATLFDGDSGERLEQRVVEPGSSCFLLVHDEHAGRSRYREPPAFLAPERLGRCGAWQAWSIQIPQSADAQVRDWCGSIGYQLAKPSSRLVLITPPRRYSDAGVAVVSANEDIVLGLLPAGAGQDTNTSAAFYTTRFQRPGTFRVTVDDAADAALYLTVEPRPTEARINCPAGLAIVLEWGGSKVELDALRDGVGAHRDPVRRKALREQAAVQVRCAVPLTLLWELGAALERRDQLAADEAGALIEELLQKAAQQAAPLVLQLDAGAYGRLYLELGTQTDTPAATPTLPPAVKRRARWLATALTGMAGETGIPLTASDRRVLEQLAALPGCDRLRDLRAVPVALAPHMRAIVRLVQK